MPSELEESVPEGDHREKAIQLIIEDEVSIIPPPALAQQTPEFIKNLQDSMLYYSNLKTKRLGSSMGLFKSETHPFLKIRLMYLKK